MRTRSSQATAVVQPNDSLIRPKDEQFCKVQVFAMRHIVAWWLRVHSSNSTAQSTPARVPACGRSIERRGGTHGDRHDRRAVAVTAFDRVSPVSQDSRQVASPYS